MAQPFHLVLHYYNIFLYLTFSSSTLAGFSLYKQTCLTFCNKIMGEMSFLQLSYLQEATIAPRVLRILWSHRPSLTLLVLYLATVHGTLAFPLLASFSSLHFMCLFAHSSFSKLLHPDQVLLHGRIYVDSLNLTQC